MMPFFYRLNLLSISSFFLYLFSLLIIGFSYQSFEPYIVISTLSFIFISITYLLCGRNNFDDFISTLLIFTVCLFWSSVSSIYLNVFNDSQYFGADSGFFLELSKGERFENPILFGSNFYDGIGAVKAIEKMKRGLSDHPQVAAVLKRQNEDLDLVNAAANVLGEKLDKEEAVIRDRLYRDNIDPEDARQLLEKIRCQILLKPYCLTYKIQTWRMYTVEQITN